MVGFCTVCESRYGKQPNRKSYEIKLLQNGSLRWEGPHSRGRNAQCPFKKNATSAMTGGMLAGLLEEDEEGWYLAHLLTGQNEPIGPALSLRPKTHCFRSLCKPTASQGSIRLRHHASRRDAVVSNFRSLAASREIVFLSFRTEPANSVRIQPGSHSMGEWGSNIASRLHWGGNTV